MSNHELNLYFCTEKAMVAGLKTGSRVQARATKVLGQNAAKISFPTTFESQILHGVVVRKGAGRKMVVKWDGIGETTTVASRMLDNEVEVTSAVASGNTPVADSSTASAAVTTTATTEHVEGSDEEQPVNPAFDEDEAEAANNPGEDLLTPHNCRWEKAPDGITVDIADRATMGPRIKWRDGLDNDRSPLQYFLHFYPSGHLGAGGTISVTNSKLHSNGLDEITRQEYFVYVGIMFTLSFYPKFSTRDLFSPSAPCRRSSFLSVPNLSQYMTFNDTKI